MSSSDRSTPSRRAAGAVLVGSLLLLASCGFRPLYRQDASGATVPQMAAISIPAPPDRLHQLLRNELLDRLNPTGQAVASRYVLTLKVTEARGAVLVTRTESVSRFNLTEALDYTLTDASTRTILIPGTLNSTASYNVLRAEYANLAAEEDARVRAARDLADLLRARIALFFERGGQPETPAADGKG